jgi:TIR domain
LIPVIIGDIPIPQFIQDLYAVRVPDMALPGPFKLPANDIDKAVKAHLLQMEDTRGPKLFISHRHKEEKIVSALVDVLRSAFVIDQSDIRCTSVRPYRLPVGERTPDRLKRELKGAQAVIGIITPDTRESSYVLFELGGAWAQNILTCPMLARGASIAEIPDPIRDINPLSLEDERDCQQFLDDLEDATTLKRQSRVGGDVAERIRKLVEGAKKKKLVEGAKKKKEAN